MTRCVFAAVVIGLAGLLSPMIGMAEAETQNTPLNWQSQIDNLFTLFVFLLGLGSSALASWVRRILRRNKIRRVVLAELKQNYKHMNHAMPPGPGSAHTTNDLERAAVGIATRLETEIYEIYLPELSHLEGSRFDEIYEVYRSVRQFRQVADEWNPGEVFPLTLVGNLHAKLTAIIEKLGGELFLEQNKENIGLGVVATMAHREYEERVAAEAESAKPTERGEAAADRDP